MLKEAFPWTESASTARERIFFSDKDQMSCRKFSMNVSEKKLSPVPAQRLESLDALRGFDLFILTMLGPVMHAWLGWKRWAGWLKIIGMNSILAYMLSPEVGLINFNGISRPLLGGLLRACDVARPEIFFAAGNAAVLFLILWLCYRAKIFLKA